MDWFQVAEAALKGVMLLTILYAIVLTLRVVRWLWRLATGVSVDQVARTTGAAAAHVDEAARGLAKNFKDGWHSAKR